MSTPWTKGAVVIYEGVLRPYVSEKLRYVDENIIPVATRYTFSFARSVFKHMVLTPSVSHKISNEELSETMEQLKKLNVTLF